MPSIRGSMIHVPKPPPKGRGQRAADSARSAGARAKAKAEQTYGNATSRKATTPKGEKIGGRPKGPKQEAPDSIAARDRGITRFRGGLYGAVGGTFVGAGTGTLHAKKKYPETKELYKINKARAYRITDLGTRADRAYKKTPKGPKRWPEFPRKSMAGGALGGAGLTHYSVMRGAKEEADYVKQRKKKMSNLEKRLNATKEEKHKALVWNKDFTNKGPYTKQERKIAGKIMSKEQLKGQAKGWSAGAAGGAAVGAGAAAATRSNKKVGAIAGGAVGGLAGQLRGDYTGRVKGQRRYKEVLGKSTSISAFGVNHG